MGRRRGVAPVVVVLAFLGSGCGGAGGARATADVRMTEPAPSSVAAAPPSLAVPAAIDVAYVQRVMNVLDHVTGDAIRALVAAGGPDRRFYELLDSVYDDPAFSQQKGFYGEDAARGLTMYRRPPGDIRTRVTKVYASSDHCIVVGADRSSTGVLTDGIEHAVLLQFSRAAANPTPWVITHYVENDGRATMPEHVCD